MRKKLLFFLAGMMLLVAGCGKKEAAPETQTSDQTTSQKTETTASVDEKNDSAVEEEAATSIKYDQSLYKTAPLPIEEVSSPLSPSDFAVYNILGPEQGENKEQINLLIFENNSDQLARFTIREVYPDQDMDSAVVTYRDVAPGETVLTSEHLHFGNVPEKYVFHVEPYSSDMYAAENEYDGAKDQYEEVMRIREEQAGYTVGGCTTETRDDGRIIIHFNLKDKDGKDVTGGHVTDYVQPAILCFDEAGNYVETGAIGFGTIGNDMSTVVPGDVKGFAMVTYSNL